MAELIFPQPSSLPESAQTLAGLDGRNRGVITPIQITSGRWRSHVTLKTQN